MPASMTEAIHESIDPTALPPKIQSLLEELGYFLQLGLAPREIGERLEPRRSEDWVSGRVAEIRRAWAEQVLEVAGDKLDAEQRSRLGRA